MNVRIHVRSPNGLWCLLCGAKFSEASGGFGSEATCALRDDGQDPRAMRPEPALRRSGVDDREVIAKRLGELYEESTRGLNTVDGVSG